MENRVIKFRAWDSELKFMVDPSVYIISFSGVPFFDNRGDVIEQSKKLVLMQFTGLCDKNGKEIYEGDVLKRIVTVPNVDGEGVFIEKVVYGDGGFDTINIANDESGYLREYLFHTVEVIGNIFENPELLKTDTDGTKN